MAKKRKKPKRVGLVLSGGAARGIAHLGVLSVLADRKIPIDCIVAASYGSIVAAYYAFGYSPDHLALMMQEFRSSSIINLRNPWRWIYDGGKLLAILEEDLGDVNIEELKIPLSVLALDVTEGKPVFFEHGPLLAAIRASTALPGLFAPLALGGRLYIDGGMLRGLLVKTARERGAQLVVDSDVSLVSSIERKRWARRLYVHLAKRAVKRRSRLWAHPERTGLRSLYGRAICVYETERAREGEKESATADVTIRSVDSEIRPLQFRNVKRAVGLGIRAALERVGEIEDWVRVNDDPETGRVG